MKIATFKSPRYLVLLLSAAALVVAIAILAVDFTVRFTKATEQTKRLRAAEVAARNDPTATESFNVEVKQQTAQSLASTRRQRAAGIVFLTAAGICVALVKWRKSAKPPLPTTVSKTVARQLTSSGSGASTEELPQHVEFTPSPVDLTPIEAIVTKVGREQRHLIPLLHAIDQEYHYLPPPTLSRLADLTGIPRPQIAEVATFYSKFRTRPRGKHLVQVCRGTACHVYGADLILEETRRLLNIPPGSDTDPEGNATIEVVGCLGCCTLAPVVRVDDRIVGHAEVQALPSVVDWNSPATVREDGDQLLAVAKTNGVAHGRAKENQKFAPYEIRVGLGSCCVAGGSRDVLASLQRELKAQHLNATIKQVGCVGICHLTPLVEVVRPNAEPIVATKATPADVRRIVRSLPPNVPWQNRWRSSIRNMWQSDPPSAITLTPCDIIPTSDLRMRRFIDPQVRIVTEHSGVMDPTSLEEYRARDGFVALKRVLQVGQPTTVLDAIERSGLRGRGGAGFPTATKWRRLHQAAGEKFLVCNGDEGDPGAFMDRMIMESYAYRVLEGMAIASYALGVGRAFIYVRHEYPLAVRRLRNAIEQMTSDNLLGDRILGHDFSLHVEIVEGGGAFVCGEETALLQSIMGHRGTPQLRPPYPVESGLWGRPTLVNNVETLANVPWIVRNGPERFAAYGTAASKGTKVFSLAGKVCRGGLIEVPMGMTIRQVVEEIGGNVAEGKRFKAVQIGGPSGGCIPASLADTPIDYESLRQVGAIMGSGGLIVLDDDDCMVDIARYFLEFTQRESCGHCTFCRVGTRKLLDVLERLCAGHGKPGDLKEIETLCHSTTMGSLCGLGKTAPNPVLTTLRYFRDEYEAHLAGRCPAGRCKALIRYDVTRDCIGCTICAQKCPVGAIEATPYRQHWIDPAICTRCDVCRTSCPEDAIRVV